jgi:hypothetical protein
MAIVDGRQNGAQSFVRFQKTKVEEVSLRRYYSAIVPGCCRTNAENVSVSVSVGLGVLPLTTMLPREIVKTSESGHYSTSRPD